MSNIDMTSSSSSSQAIASVTSRVDQTVIERLFQDHDIHTRLFPSGIIVRDSQSFGVGPSYLSNVALLCGDRLTAIYVTSTRGHGSHGYRALSFGSCVECGAERDMLRYCVDYYGDACLDCVIYHVTQHLRVLVTSLSSAASAVTARTVTCQLYAPEAVLTSDMRTRLFDAMTSSFGVYVNRKREYRQCVVDVKDDPWRLNEVRHKL